MSLASENRDSKKYNRNKFDTLSPMQPKTKIMSAVLLKPKTVKVAATGSSLNLGNGQGRVINLQVSVRDNE